MHAHLATSLKSQLFFFERISLKSRYRKDTNLIFDEVLAAVWGRQNNAVGQSLLEQSDMSRQLRMQSLSNSHALTSRSQPIFSF